LGGLGNAASGKYAAIPGGVNNLATGDESFAAGHYAEAVHDGSFVWSDGVSNVAFSSTGVNQFLIDAAGGVGIGTNSPEAPMHVLEGSAGTVSAHSNACAVFERSSNGYVQILTPDADESGVMFGNPTSGVAGGLYYNSTAANGLTFRCNGNSTKMVIDSAGNVGVGTTSPLFLLHVDGSAGKPGGGSWSVASDERLKHNVQALSGALERLLELHGVTFEYVDPESIGELDGERVGLIAQEVEKVFPDWVEEGPDGYKRLTVRGFEALAIEALRELDLARRETALEVEGLRAELARVSAAVRPDRP
jgi:hypothetical protein